MPQTKPSELRKSKWERTTSTEPKLPLKKPLVEYDNFSSSGDDTRFTSKSLEKYKKSRKSINKRDTSTNRKGSFIEQSRRGRSASKNDQDKHSNKASDKRKHRLKSSVQKVPSRKRSRSSSLSFTSSDLSDDTMNRHVPPGSYEGRYPPRSPVRDSYVNHRQALDHRAEKWEPSTRFQGRDRSPHAYASPQHGYPHGSSHNPILQRSLSPGHSPSHHSPTRRKDAYSEYSYQDTRIVQDRCRSPVYMHAPAYSETQR